MKQLSFSFVCLLLLAGCTSHYLPHKVAYIKERSCDQAGAEAVWQRYECRDALCESDVAQRHPDGLSRFGAVSIALENSPDLQAVFEELGISRAELKQAALYSNPEFHAFWNFPLDPEFMASESYMLQTFFQLSDLWEVPLRKNVAKDQLEIITLKILTIILNVTRDVKQAYNECVYAQENLLLTQYITQEIRALRDRIYYRQQFGYTIDFDKWLADATVGTWHARIIDRENDLATAYIKLRRILGIEVSSSEVPLTDSLLTLTHVPDIQNIIDIAMRNRPELHMACFNVQKAEHTLKFERSRVFKDIEFGLEHERGFGPPRGTGPVFRLDVPIFDMNQAQVMRAKYFVAKAEQEYRITCFNVREEVALAYGNVNAFSKQVIVYDEVVIPAQEKARQFADQYLASGQMNMVVLLQAFVMLYKQELRALRIQFQYANFIVDLERAIACNLI